MAHERGQADEEAGISMRAWQWIAWKKRDATRCPFCKAVVFPGGQPGTFDFPVVKIPLWQEGKLEEISVEVKAGTTNLPFAALSGKQRKWAEEHSETPKWLWICLGEHIRHEKYPRYSVLIPLELFLEIEQESTRKSIPYGHPRLEAWQLQWLGKKVWGVPWGHPLIAQYRYFEEAMICL